MYKKIIFGLLFVGFCSILLFFILLRPRPFVFFTIPKAHSFILDGSQSCWEFDLYCNQKKNPLVNKQKINQIYLQNEEFSFQIQIEDIILLSRHNIDNQHYYQFQLSFMIPIQDNYTMNKAFILFDIKEQEEIEIFIGSFGMFEVVEYGSPDWGITNLKAIVNEIQNKKVIVGVIVHFYNKQLESIQIQSILPLNQMMENTHLILVEEENISSSTAIEEWLDEPYGENTNPLTPITFQNEAKILAVIDYYELYQIPTFALKIDYTVNEEVKTAYLETFTYYHDHQQTISLSDIVFYHYENY